MSLRKEDLSNESLSNQPAGVAPVVEALTRVASDPKVRAWFEMGGKRIPYVNKTTSVGWNGLEVAVLELVNICDSEVGREEGVEVVLGLHVRDGGFAANKTYTGSGTYFFEEGTWKPLSDVPDFPSLGENPVFIGLVSKNMITAETITSQAESKTNVIPMVALREEERQALAIKAKEMYWTEYELNGLLRDLDETPAVNFLGRYGLYKEIVRKLEEAKGKLPDYQAAFAKRDDSIRIDDEGAMRGSVLCPSVGNMVNNFSDDITVHEGQLENHENAFCVNVSDAFEGLAHRAFWGNDDRLATCWTVETLRETLREAAVNHEEATGAEIDIIREPSYIPRAGKALEYTDLQLGGVAWMLEKTAKALEIKDTLGHLDRHTPVKTIEGIMHELFKQCQIGSLTGDSALSFGTAHIEATLKEIQTTTDRKELKRLVATLPETFHIRSIVEQQVLPKRWYDGILRLFGRD